MRRIRLIVFAFLIFIVVSTVAYLVILRQGDPCFNMIDNPSLDGLITFKGHYLAQFEVSSFVPCGCDLTPGYGQGYWLEWDQESGFSRAYQMSFPSADMYGSGTVVYVLFEGKISNYGPHGHLGMYLREITVTELLEAEIGKVCPLREL